MQDSIFEIKVISISLMFLDAIENYHVQAKFEVLLFKITTDTTRIVDIVLTSNMILSFKPFQGLGGDTQRILIFSC